MSGTQYWAWAPSRKRSRRTQKKIDARGGALHHLPPIMRRGGLLAFWMSPTGPFGFHILSSSRSVVRAPNRGAAILWFEHCDRVVKKSWVGDSEVSTVFLGLDHGFGFGGPLWFETMIFGGPLDQSQRRYGTWKDAVEGHETAVEELRMELRSTRVNPSSDSYTH